MIAEINTPQHLNKFLTDNEKLAFASSNSKAARRAADRANESRIRAGINHDTAMLLGATVVTALAALGGVKAVNYNHAHPTAPTERGVNIEAGNSSGGNSTLPGGHIANLSPSAR
jgi:hypothetical protein